jgi:wyosine [tRNA(Phe)-imidazoG37] synthetase (radical SAM superfamily)
MNALTRRLPWFVAAVLTTTCATAVMAQGRNDGTEAAGSLGTLTAELRQLRVAVEELTRSQTQTQALGVYLSVQQSRILQVAARLDSARKELETASIRSQEIATTLANLDDEVLRVAEPQQRRQIEEGIRGLKYEQTSVGLREQHARSRETELAQALQQEELRWTDLISRLETLIKK